MGIILDTCVFVDFERQQKSFNFQQWKEYKLAYISVVTVSELLVGVHRANTKQRHLKRSAFVEAILAKVPVLDFNSSTARIHAEIYADLAKRGILIGAHDLIIAATAIAHNCAILTANENEFKRVSGLKLVTYNLSKYETVL